MDGARFFVWETGHRSVFRGSGNRSREVARRKGNFVVSEVADRLDVRATGVWVECTRLTHDPGNREMRVDTTNSSIAASDR